MTLTIQHDPPQQPPAKRAGVRLHTKSIFFLMGLLICAVALCGLVFNTITGSMLRTNQEAQARQLAYAVAAILGNDLSIDRHDWQGQLNQLDKTPNLRFALLTDAALKPVAAFDPDANDGDQTDDIREIIAQKITGLIGAARPFQFSNHSGFVVTVPVISHAHKLLSSHSTTQLLGYLHLGMDNDQNIAQLQHLQAFVLMTCMGVVLLSIPIATLIARHITGPIKRLAIATHALAAGDLAHRVSMERSDELGELAQAFNGMAERLELQQDDIRQINAGLEAAVSARTAELQKVNTRLHAEISEKEDFIRAVSHDLNAPLRNISGMAAMLIMKYQNTLEKDALQRLERIQKNVEVECALINELLELSRIKTRREKFERVDLNSLIREVGEQFSNDFETREITFKVTTQLPVMHAEKSRLRQLFQNLIDNGVKYMRQDGPRQIIVGLLEEESDLTFTFTDTGMGIAPEDLPNVFHVFRRAKNASMMNIPGKGVGLACVKSIVDNYNGSLRVESTLGTGTTFFVSLPRQYFNPVPQEVAV